MKGFKQLYINNRFYYLCALLVVVFTIGHFVGFVYFLAKLLLFVAIIALIIDAYLLFFFKNQRLYLTRELPERLSNGDTNRIELFLQNSYLFPIQVEVIDELPFQFQKRDFNFKLALKPREETKFNYKIKPLHRGEYIFGRTNAYVTGTIGLITRRFIFGEKETVIPAYPSFLKMRRYELLAISDRLTEVGIKRIRRIGAHTDFDQIKEYVKGDNYRTINWKATAKNNRLMVNTYQEERAQQVYNLIDMGRSMQMPFNGMSLLDYAINSTLILSNISLQRHDKAGLLTFNKGIETFLPAERKKRTISILMEMLYKQETNFMESDFALLATYVRRKITHRSLLILYTNFQSPASIRNQIASIKNIARNHLLLVVMFENTEVNKLVHSNPHSLEDIYVKTIAEKYTYDKKLIVRELKKHGILSILTKPENLSANLINKYLELKQIGLI